ncbi:unnamed protein product, partial [Iphiclides podalirius]
MTALDLRVGVINVQLRFIRSSLILRSILKKSYERQVSLNSGKQNAGRQKKPKATKKNMMKVVIIYQMIRSV